MRKNNMHVFVLNYKKGVIKISPMKSGCVVIDKRLDNRIFKFSHNEIR